MLVNFKFHENQIKKGLYLVSTPIGNLNDITLRAIEILRRSDYILCEDTRVSKNLLQRYEINSKLISNHKFNEKKNLSKIIQLLKRDTIISLISDAGTPGISDPGSVLVKECEKNDIEIIPLPGPSAVSSAVSLSGFSEKFFFYGFFPEKKKVLEEDLKILSQLNSSLVFFISPKKINKIIPILRENFSGRKILICREMTKYYEEYIRSDVDKLDVFKKQIKGELTIVISENTISKKNSHILSESDKRIIKKMICKISIKEIIELINENNNVSKKEIYNYCLKLKNEI
jgi:16S rRNA (cytidine1402-2'-O)-methyltransferase